MLTPAGTRELVPLSAVFAKLAALHTIRFGDKELAELALHHEMEVLQLESCLSRGVLREGAVAYKLMLAFGSHIESIVSSAMVGAMHARPGTDVLDEDETHDVLRELKAARAARAVLEPESLCMCVQVEMQLAPVEMAKKTLERETRALQSRHWHRSRLHAKVARKDRMRRRRALRRPRRRLGQAKAGFDL